MINYSVTFYSAYFSGKMGLDGKCSQDNGGKLSITDLRGLTNRAGLLACH
jgi:hypothetical protein